LCILSTINTSGQRNIWLYFNPLPIEKINPFISRDTTPQAIEYNLLKTKSERDSLILERIKPDWTSSIAQWTFESYPNGIPPSEYPFWACGNSSLQLMINSINFGEGINDDGGIFQDSTLLYNGYKGFNLDSILKNRGSLHDMGSVGVPMMVLVLENPDTLGDGHGMNASITGNDITKWEDWNFIEPQFDDTKLQPGQDYLFSNTRYATVVYYYLYKNKNSLKFLTSRGLTTFSIKNGVPNFEGTNPYLKNLLILKRDTVVPIIEISSPNEGTTYNFLNPNLKFKFTDENLKCAWYSLDNGIEVKYDTLYNELIVNYIGVVPVMNRLIFFYPIKDGIMLDFEKYKKYLDQGYTQNEAFGLLLNGYDGHDGYYNSHDLFYNDFYFNAYSSEGSKELDLPNGNYKLIVYAEDDFRLITTDTISFTVSRTTDLSNNTTKPGFKIYPNPIRSVTQFSYTTGISVQIEIFDVSGLLINKKQDTDLNGETPIDFTDYGSGLYMYRVIDGDGHTYSGKVLKE